MALLDTLIFAPSPCGFPKPRAPLLPTGLDGIGLHPPAPWAPSINFRHYTRGRYALRDAYRLAGLGPGAALLAPAYHCRTMIDPAIALGGEALLYPLNADLSPDMAAIENLADHSPAPVKVLLATHFFGFAQALAPLAGWCAKRGIILIEDGSHSLFCRHYQPDGIGRHGRFVVSSPYKFMPSPDGGLLYARTPAALPAEPPAAPGWMDELRGVARQKDKAAEHRRQRRTLAASLPGAPASVPMAAVDRRESAGCSPDYHREEENTASLRLSRWLYTHPDIEHISRSRRANYQRWTEATRNRPGLRPLYPTLPANTIPYMFPLLIDAPETQFFTLKYQGLPIWRWDSMVASTCPVATDYRLRLLHLPCHQSLSIEELDWMIAAVQKVGAGKTVPYGPDSLCR